MQAIQVVRQWEEVVAQVSLQGDTLGVSTGGAAETEKHELETTTATIRQVKRQ